MGSFSGHLLSGTCFILFAAWWTVSIFKRYYAGKSRHGSRFINTVTYPITCAKCQNFPIEGVLKIVLTGIDITGEIVTALDNKGQFVNIGNGQHVTLKVFFCLSGIIDIAMHKGVRLPKNTDYVAGGLSFIIEGLMLSFHLHGLTQLDATIHILLIYVTWACVLSGAAELMWPTSVLAGLSRAFFVMLQGTWLCQIGFISYPPIKSMAHWNGADHHQIMLATIIFAWHVFIIFALMCVTGLVVGRCYGQDSSARDGSGCRLIGAKESAELEQDDLLIETRSTE